MRSLFDKETLNVLQQKARDLEDCFNNPNLEEETKAHLQELANSRGKTLEQLKEDIASYSERLRGIVQLEIEHEQLMQQMETASEDELSLNLNVYKVRFEIHVLLIDLLDNYWDFFPADYSKILFRQLAHRIHEVFSLCIEELRQIKPIPQARNVLTHFENFTDIVQKSLNSAVEAGRKVGSLSEIEAVQLRPKSLISKSSSRADESLRAIAYSMDLLLPGFYAWVGKIRIRIGGAEPDDTPYRYPGTIHSPAGIALVLPGYRIFTTYQGTHDPRQA